MAIWKIRRLMEAKKPTRPVRVALMQEAKKIRVPILPMDFRAAMATGYPATPDMPRSLSTYSGQEEKLSGMPSRALKILAI